jgi:SAM-dependent methyltransferase
MDAEELKQIFQEGWTNPDVVAHRVERFIRGEFGFAPSHRAWREALLEAAIGAPGKRVVDMGTGPGSVAQFWAELGLEVTGVDFSTTMLKAAGETFAQRGFNAEFVEADVETPPFAEATFDIVSSRAVLFTLPHPGYTVARWIRLLKPGGLLILIGENSPTDPEKLSKQYRPAPRWSPDERYRQALEQLPFRNHTDDMVRVVLEAAGLQYIQNINMQSVIAARGEHEKLDPEYGVLQGTPYILVGQLKG